MEIRRRKFNQIALVVSDLEKAIDLYENILGVDPFNSIDPPPKTVLLHGKEVVGKSKIALGRMDNGIQIELIEPVEGMNVHMEFLQTRGVGLHHYGEYVDDAEAEAKMFEEQGFEIAQVSENSGIMTIYVDMLDTIGAYWELVQIKPRKRARRKKKFNGG